jgi:hypothetical protein
LPDIDSIQSIFEPIFDGHILAESVIATLKLWMPTYLQEIELQRGTERGAIPVPRVYTTRNEFTTFPEDIIPLVIVISPGLEPGSLKHNGEGKYRAWWGIGVGVLAAANTEANSDRIAKIYGAAVRAILLQNQELDEQWEYSGVEPIDESYTDVPDPEQEKTMRSARLVFRVGVEQVVSKWAGPPHPVPPDPVTQPGSEWPPVEETDVEVLRKEEE